MSFEEGQTVYRVGGVARDEITQHVIERATKTQVFISHGNREEKYTRDGGEPIPRGEGLYRPRLMEESPSMRLRYAQSARMRVAEAMQRATIDFKREHQRTRSGGLPETINVLVDEWIAVNLAVAEAEKGKANA